MRKFEVEFESRIIVPVMAASEEDVWKLAEGPLTEEIEKRFDEKLGLAHGETIIRHVTAETVEDVSAA